MLKLLSFLKLRLLGCRLLGVHIEDHLTRISLWLLLLKLLMRLSHIIEKFLLILHRFLLRYSGLLYLLLRLLNLIIGGRPRPTFAHHAEVTVITPRVMGLNLSSLLRRLLF